MEPSLPYTFEVSETPMASLVDIVVLVHDRPDWAELCVRSVENFTKNPYRLIVVDMASREERTKDLFVEWKERGHTVVHLNENRSFSNGVNAGVRAGSSKFIIVLNDDALATEGWDSALLQDASEKRVGLVGARSNAAAGAQGGVKCDGDPPYLVFVCVCLRREVWDAVGPLDEETFDGFSSEDLDYSWRVLKGGLRLKLSNAFVLHAGSRTLIAKNGQPDAYATQVALAKNNEKYNIRLVEKWGEPWVKEHTKFVKRILVATFSPQEYVSMGFAKACMSLKQAGGYEFAFYHHVRTPIHLARQLVVDFALRENFDVLVQLDDDSTFPPDLLPRLLKHNKGLVCAMAYQRKPPYKTVAYTLDEEQMKLGNFMGQQMEGIEHTGLRSVDVNGLHVSALRLDVIRKLHAYREKDEKGAEKYPQGIRQYFGGFENKVGEDFAFCLNLKKVGEKVWVDTDLISGHIAEPFIIDEAYKAAHNAGQAR